MDKFIVSARKYRPQTFDTVVGQSHITTTLKNAIIQNQLAHAFLFCGPRGVGKTTCARILGKTINCENQTPEGEACNVCPSCVSFNQGTSLNIYELDAASNNSVDDIRTLVDQVRFAPQAGKYKVYIIDEVHMLSSSAFNAFLKTLEEPPLYAIFILATTEKHKILPTILSRCQIFDFKRITVKDTVNHLEEICKKENVQAEQAALQIIAQKSEGCMRDALSIMDKIVSFTNGHVDYTNTLEHLNILDEDYYFRLMDHIIQQDLSGALLLYDDINRKGFEGDLVLNGFAEFIRNLLVSKDEKVAALLDTVESFKEKYTSVAKQISPQLLISALNILNEAEMNYRTARNKRLHVELALIKLCYLQQALQLTAGTNGLSKKKLIDTANPVAFRQIQPIVLNDKPKERPKPIVEKQKEARLIIDQEPEKIIRPVSTIAKSTNDQEKKITSLEKLRKQFKAAEPQKEDSPLQEESLKKAWSDFVTQLKADKNSAAQSFEMADLKILDANSFYVYTATNIQYRFVDSCKNLASEFLQNALNNSQLQIYVILKVDNSVSLHDNTGKPMTALQRYKKMVEKYPLLKEFKEKLKLELER